MRLLIAVLAASALLVSACGGGGDSATERPAAAPEAKLTEITKDGRSNEAAASPGARPPAVNSDAAAIGATQPCKLVSRGQAKAILGGTVLAPLEAPQGPTCIYRTKDGKGYVTLAVQSEDFGRLAKKLQMTKRADIGDNRAYCGVNGQDVLYAQVSDEWVLSVAGPCKVAQRFAEQALKAL